MLSAGISHAGMPRWASASMSLARQAVIRGTQLNGLGIYSFFDPGPPRAGTHGDRTYWSENLAQAQNANDGRMLAHDISRSRLNGGYIYVHDAGRISMPENTTQAWLPNLCCLMQPTLLE